MGTSLGWQLNPIIVKELRSRMRGVRAFATLTGALLLLGVFSYALYRMVIVASRYSSTPLSPQIGQALFAGIAFLELIIVAAVTPSVTAGAISGEHEKQTYEMLLVTPLHPSSILWGKLVSALGYVFIILFAAIPMVSLVFIFGGVTVREMVKVLIMLAAIAVMFGVIGLFTSAAFGRTGRATAVAYLIVLLMLFGPLFAAVVTGVMRGGDPPRWILVPSPISALASAMSPSVNPSNISSMFWMLGSPTYWIFGVPPISMTSIPRPLYHYSLPLFMGITLVCYLLAARFVRPTRRWQIHWSEALVGLILVLGFLGLTLLAFGLTSNRYENVLLNASFTATPAPIMVEPGLLPPDGSMEATPVPPEDAEATPTPLGLVIPPPHRSPHPFTNFPIYQSTGLPTSPLPAHLTPSWIL